MHLSISSASQEDWNFTAAGPVNSVSMSGDGSLAVAGANTLVYAFDANGTLLWQKNLGNGTITSVAVSRNGSRVVVAKNKNPLITNGSQFDKVLFLYDRNGNVIWEFSDTFGVKKVDISDDGSKVAVNSEAYMYFFDDQTHTFKFPAPGGFGVVSVSTTLQQLGQINSTFILRDFLTSTFISNSGEAFDLSGDGMSLVTGSPDGSVTLFTTGMRIADPLDFAPPGIVERTKFSLGSFVNVVSFSKDNIFAAGTDSGLLRVFDQRGPTIIGSINVGTSFGRGVITLDVSHNGLSLVTTDALGKVYFVSTSSGLPILRKAFGGISGGGLSPQLMISDDGRFAPHSGSQVLYLLDREKWALDQSFWFNGATDRDSVDLRVWFDALPGFLQVIKSLAISSDGLNIIVGRESGIISHLSATPRGSFDSFVSPNPINIRQGSLSSNFEIITQSLNGFENAAVTVKSATWLGTAPANLQPKLLGGRRDDVVPNINGSFFFNIPTITNSTPRGNYVLRLGLTSGPIEKILDIPINVLGPPDLNISSVETTLVRVMVPLSGFSTTRVKINVTSIDFQGQVGFVFSDWVGTAPNWIGKSFEPQILTLGPGDTKTSDLVFRVESQQTPSQSFVLRTKVTGTPQGFASAITREGPDITIQVVSSSTLDHFEFDTISSPQSATIPFLVTIRAINTSGIVAEDFGGSVNLQVVSGGVSMNPLTSPTFNRGVVTFPVSINSPANGVSIQASHRVGLTDFKTGTSNLFNVGSGPDFGIGVNPSSVQLQLANQTTTTLTVTSLLNFSGNVTLVGAWVGTAPNAVTVNFPSTLEVPSGGTNSAQVTISATQNAATGPFTYRITGTSALDTHASDIIVNIASVDFSPRISALEAWRQNVESFIESLRQADVLVQLNDLTTRISLLENSQSSVNTTIINDLNVTIYNINTAINNINNLINSISAQISQVNLTVDNLQANIISVQSNLQGQINSLFGLQNNQSSQISTLENNTRELESQIQELKNNNTYLLNQISLLNQSLDLDLRELDLRINQLNISTTNNILALEIELQTLQFQNAELRTLLTTLNATSTRDNLEILALKKLSFKPDINEFLAKNCLDLKLALVAPTIAADKAKQDLATDLLLEAVNTKNDASNKLSAAMGIIEKAIKSSSLSIQDLSKLDSFISGATSDISNITINLNEAKIQLNNLTTLNMSLQTESIQLVITALEGEVSVLNSATSAILANNFTYSKSLLENALSTEAVIKQDIESTRNAIIAVNIGQTTQDEIRLECAKSLPRPEGQKIKLPLGVQFENLNLTEKQALEQKVRDIEAAFLESLQTL